MDKKCTSDTIDGSFSINELRIIVNNWGKKPGSDKALLNQFGPAFEDEICKLRNMLCSGKELLDNDFYFLKFLSSNAGVKTVGSACQPCTKQPTV